MRRMWWFTTLIALVVAAMLFVTNNRAVSATHDVLQGLEEISHGNQDGPEEVDATPEREPAASPPQGANPRTQAANATQQDAIANTLGWRLGTEWTVRVEEYAEYLVEPDWITTEYRFTVVGVDPTTNTFTVSMRFADPSIQPEDAQGDLLVAQYTVNTGNLTLAALQPHGKGPALPVEQAQELLGNNFFSLEVPESPFRGGRSGEEVEVPGRGRVAANEVPMGPNATATFAQDVPWWVSYSQGEHLRAQLKSFTQ